MFFFFLYKYRNPHTKNLFQLVFLLFEQKVCFSSQVEINSFQKLYCQA